MLVRTNGTYWEWFTLYDLLIMYNSCRNMAVRSFKHLGKSIIG